MRGNKAFPFVFFLTFLPVYLLLVLPGTSTNTPKKVRPKAASVAAEINATRAEAAALGVFKSLGFETTMQHYPLADEALAKTHLMVHIAAAESELVAVTLTNLINGVILDRIVESTKSAWNPVRPQALLVGARDNMWWLILRGVGCSDGCE